MPAKNALQINVRMKLKPGWWLAMHAAWALVRIGFADREWLVNRIEDLITIHQVDPRGRIIRRLK